MVYRLRTQKTKANLLLIGGCALFFVVVLLWLIFSKRATTDSSNPAFVNANRTDHGLGAPVTSSGEKPGTESGVKSSNSMGAAKQSTAALNLQSFIRDRDQDHGVRADAVIQLVADKDHKARVNLIMQQLATLDDFEADRGPRIKCIELLGDELVSERARGRLVEGLKPIYPVAERIAVVQTMAQHKTPWVIPYLEQARRDSQSREFTEAIEKALKRVRADS